ncbi:MAG: hypothetical protein AAGA15_11610, partial [Pseudomonadota bacterium]
MTASVAGPIAPKPVFEAPLSGVFPFDETLRGWRYLTAFGGVVGIVGFGGGTPSTGTFVLAFFASLLTMGLIVVLNLQMGRAKLRLFENPLDPPSTALIVVLIICT